MFFKQSAPKKLRLALRAAGGFQAGDLVQHKVTGLKAVIVALFHEDERDWATVSVGWTSFEEFDTTVAEIEPWRSIEVAPAVESKRRRGRPRRR